MAGYPKLLQKLLQNGGAGPKLLASILPDGLLTETLANGLYLGKNDTAKSAEKATNDGNGKAIDKTYIPMAGERGTLAGFETLTTSSEAAITITDSSPDDTGSSGAVAISVENGATGKVWTKTVGIDNDGATITLGDLWRWQDGKAPTVAAYSVLILKWYGTWGYASLALTS